MNELSNTISEQNKIQSFNNIDSMAKQGLDNTFENWIAFNN